MKVRVHGHRRVKPYGGTTRVKGHTRRVSKSRSRSHMRSHALVPIAHPASYSRSRSRSTVPFYQSKYAKLGGLAGAGLLGAGAIYKRKYLYNKGRAASSKAKNLVSRYIPMWSMSTAPTISMTS